MRKDGLSRYVAFLRGINVGGHRVKMERLRTLFEALGFTNVSTYIASGNVIFDTNGRDAHAIEGKIERLLEESLGFGAATFLRTPPELARIVAYVPFEAGAAEAPGHTLHVAFHRDPIDEETARLIEASGTPMDEFRVQGREFYWLCRGKITESKVSWPRVSKLVGSPSTLRNITMLRKLAALHPVD